MRVRGREPRGAATRTEPVWPVPLAVAVTVVVLSVELVAVLRATGGHFRYSLDDSYIHLALAQQISHGHYGLNPGTASSPSSSILWPFLLAPFMRLPWSEYWPLVLDAAATVATVVVLVRTLRRRMPAGLAVVVSCAALLALNLVGLAFTGMEHSLQVLLAVLVGSGVVSVVEDGRLPALLVPAMVLGPLVRYEGAGLSVGAALVLVSSGHWRPALAATLGWVSGVVAFSAFLVHLGLDPVPSSVLVKSGFAHSSAAHTVLVHVVLSLHRPFVLALLALFLLDLVRVRRWTRWHTFVAVVLGGHLAAGEYGWFGRYEVYLLAGLFPVVAASLAQVRLRAGWARAGLVSVALVPAVLSSLALVTLDTPAAARDIWSQQSQTAAFVAQEWRAPVAVNDLGLVAFRSPSDVLDLWGLSDADARRARFQSADPDWVGDVVAEGGVRLVAIYADWFEEIPSSWTLVGTIQGVRPVVSQERTVDLYVVDPGDAARVCRMLEDFARRTESPHTRVSCTWEGPTATS